MFRNKFKKITAVFLTLTSLILVNLSLFSVGAHANAVPDTGPDIFTFSTGVPVNFGFRVGQNDLVDNNVIGKINMANVYTYNYSDTPSWYGSTSSEEIFGFNFIGPNNSSADIFLEFKTGATQPYYVEIAYPLIFTDFTDLNYYYNLSVGMYAPFIPDNLNPGSIPVTYSYTFVIATIGVNGWTFTNNTVTGVSMISVNGGWAAIPMFNSDVLTSQVLSSQSTFQSSDGNTYCYLASAYFTTNFTAQNYYFDTTSQLSYEGGRSVFTERFKAVSDITSVESHIYFEDISWTDWLVNSVGSFLNFEIIPGLSFVDMLGLLIGMSLFMVFLKIFAGG